MPHSTVTADDRPNRVILTDPGEDVDLFETWVVYAEDAAGRWNGVCISLEEADTHEEAALKRAAMTLPSLSHRMDMWVSGPAYSGQGRRAMELREVTVQATGYRVLERD